MLSCSLSQDEIDADVCMCVCMLNTLCLPSAYMELSTGASRVASGPPSACTSSLFCGAGAGQAGND